MSSVRESALSPTTRVVSCPEGQELEKILLIAEDALPLREMLTGVGWAPFHLVHAPRLAIGIECLRTQPFAAVLLDLSLPDSRGIEALRAVRREAPERAVVVLGEPGDTEVAARAVREGAQDCLPKDEVTGELLARALCYAIERQQLLTRLEGSAERLFASQAQLREALSRSADAMLAPEAEPRRAEESRMAAVVEALPQFVATVDGAGRLLTLNRGGREMLGIPAECNLAEILLADLHLPCEGTPGFAERLLAAWREGSWSGMVSFLHLDGSEIPVLQTIVAHPGDGAGSFTVIAEDRRERIRLERELLQAQKLETIGRLADGVAHDVNNFLMPIMTYSELMRKRLSPDDRLYQYAEQIGSIAKHASALPRQLLAFSRKQVPQPTVFDLNTSVQEMGKMLGRLLGQDVVLKSAPAPDLGSIRADVGQMDQVILNLVVNARDAMPRGGEVVIATANVTLEDGNSAGLAPGRYVMLSVRDTGCGMDEETRSRIFEPFFTTKEQGRGTGLGLPTIQRIVREYGGGIAVETAPGQGTTFRIYLPRVDAAEPSVAAADTLSPVVGGQETILLVEDAEATRKAEREVLQSAGFTVLAASCGEEALRMAAGHSGPIHLLLTDVVMPGMSGRQLAEALAQTWPGMRTLYVSGYSHKMVLQHGVPAGKVPFLAKPVMPDALVRKVRAVLDGRGDLPGQVWTGPPTAHGAGAYPAGLD